VIIKGNVEFEIGGTRYRPAPGQDAFIPVRAMHSGAHYVEEEQPSGLMAMVSGRTLKRDTETF